MEKVNKNIEELKNKFKFSRVKQVLRDPEVVCYLNILQEQYVMCPIEKPANNIAFICKKYYVQVLIKELGLLSATSNTYQQVNDTLHNILQQQNNTLDSVFGLKKNGEKFNCLPCIYWVPKMHKIPSGARFVRNVLINNLASMLLHHSNYVTVKSMHITKKKHINSVGPKPFG